MEDLSNDVVIHQKKDGIEYIQFRKLLEYPEIKHCFTLKTNEVDFKTNNAKEKQSYEKIQKALDLDLKNFITPHQTHTDIVEVAKSSKDIFDNVDGLITDKKDITLCTKEADCTGIILYDTNKRIIGNIHSGWRGTLKKIAQKAVQKMIDVYESDPKDIICCISPHIRKCHFEVEEDVKKLFEDEFRYTGELENIITKGKEENVDGKTVQKYNIDTSLINKIILQEVRFKTRKYFRF